MAIIEHLYFVREKTPKFIKLIFPKFIRRKIDKIFFKYYFLPTKLDKLPNSNYPEMGNLEYQKSLIKKFNDNGKQTSFMTYPNLINLLLKNFNTNKSLNFLDIGGEKIDFYLKLKSEFKNINYFIFNQEKVIEPFYKLKTEFKYDNLNIIEKMDKIFNKDYDFVNFGSCIQYFDNYENLLEKISNCCEKIFFSGTHLYNSSEQKFKNNIIVKQMNVLPQINYLYFFNRKKFFSILEKKKFTLIFENKNLTDNINYDNFESYLGNISYSDFLFTKE
jgi:hypothetical protein